MVLFVNFAPIGFLGGAERWVLDHTKRISKHEAVSIVCVSAPIANLYGKIVLGRAFNERMNEASRKQLPPLYQLGWRHFVPFTAENRSVRAAFKQARLVYLKFELLELLITVYFGGVKSLRRAVGGLHTPFIYAHPNDFFGYLHNMVYTSAIARFVLNRMNKIHVLNQRDKRTLVKNLGLRNVVEIPNSLPRLKDQTETNRAKGLTLVFVGELSARKGVDVLIDIIKHAPLSYLFHIVGDGPMQTAVAELAASTKNVTYHGHLSKEAVQDLYQKSDVLLLPSRAEGLPLVILEALRAGMKIVDAEDIKLDLPKGIEFSCDNNDVSSYLSVLAPIAAGRSVNDKPKIKSFFEGRYSDAVVLPKLYKDVFGIKYV